MFVLGLAVALMYRPAMPHCSPAASTTLKRVVITSAVSVLAVVTMNSLLFSVNEVLKTLLPSLLSIFSASQNDSGSDPNFLVWMTLKAMVSPIVVALCLPTMLARGCHRQTESTVDGNNGNDENLLTRSEFARNLVEEKIDQYIQKKKTTPKQQK